MTGHARIYAVSLVLFCAPLVAAQQPAEDPAVKAQFELAEQAMKAGKFKEAIAPLKKAAKLSHDSCGRCYFALAIAHLRSGSPEDAVKTCDKALALSTDDADRAAVHNLKGTALLSIGGTDAKKLAAAEAEYRTATQLDKAAAPFHLNLARALLRQFRDPEAKQELQLCLDCTPDQQTAEQARLLLDNPRRGREEFSPAFELVTLQGQHLSSKLLTGRVVVMDFWATWCPPCRASVDELKELTRKYPTEKLVLISVSADKDDQAWRDFIAQKNMDWVQYRDADHHILTTFDIHAFPTYLVIDGEGFIKQRITGMNPQETVVHRLKETLREMPQLEGELRK
jgi:thiol-disulfide isomerase/thioredoxin